MHISSSPMNFGRIFKYSLPGVFIAIFSPVTADHAHSQSKKGTDFSNCLFHYYLSGGGSGSSGTAGCPIINFCGKILKNPHFFNPYLVQPTTVTEMPIEIESSG